ncbi:MCE family protein [Actinomadura verrucosospora]|uniref:Virulence factor Mce family protein n=1 Tax=Actinomadura verrucosospora TaxID=46165 RepID=A0A7D4A8V4_ACTVE|nr:MCE family protein [Actinomadura verrucosospora]QKG24187.1 virulence factor Mce family protein [Actinomadura verrucosospora]
MRRPRLKPVRERNPVLVAIVSITLIVAAGLAAFNAKNLPLIGGGTRYSTDFSEAAGLRSGNEVRVAGVKVGEVTGVRLAGAKVRVSFRVKDAWVGDASTVAIAIKTLLGDKYLAVDPLGPRRQDPGRTIPMDRTTSPYDVTQAFQDLATTTGQLDSKKLAESLDAISGAFAHTAPSVRQALTGVSALSKTISSRDSQLSRLLAGTRQVTGTVSDQTQDVQALLRDGNLLLDEIGRRREAIHGLLVGTQSLSQQISGLVDDEQKQLDPTLRALGRVTDLLQKNQDNLDRALKTAGPYTRLLGNTMGNGRWMDGYLCGLVPKEYAPATTPDKGCMPPRKGGH